MDHAIASLCDRIILLYNELEPSRRLLIGIAGVPGAGKSTLADPLVDLLNSRIQHLSFKGKTTRVDEATGLANLNPGRVDGEKEEENIAVAVGLDGWHHTRAELEQFPDPSEAKRRRGAAFTFNASSYLSFVQSLRSHSTLEPHRIAYPTFSHALKDPLPSPSPITEKQRIVVIEGLYTLLDVEKWRNATEEMDLKVWIEIADGIARERLIRRHLKEGVETEPEEAEKRVDGSDMLNGKWIKENLWRSEDLVFIESTEDTRFAPAD